MAYHAMLETRRSELAALEKLASPTKNLIFPIMRLQAWPQPKEGEPFLIQRSLKRVKEVLGNKIAILDLAGVRLDKDTAFVIAGREEMRRLHDPTGSHKAWVELIEENTQFIPTLQQSNEILSVQRQAQALLSLGRGLAIRLRRTQNWDLATIDAIGSLIPSNAPLIIVFDYGQIGLREDVTLLSLSIQEAALHVAKTLSSEVVRFVCAGSSFPSQFSTIHEETFNLTIKERQIHFLLSTSNTLISRNVRFEYGDNAAVFAGERAPAYKGRPRVDYPTPRSWIYHRKKEGFVAAAQAVVKEADWNDDLLCWGSQEIRRAAAGSFVGLGAPSAWTAVRINIHLHQQAYFDQNASVPTDEPWMD